ncbi:MAG: hypothetical protein RL653_3126 [Pseudomonadota bacterium]
MTLPRTAALPLLARALCALLVTAGCNEAPRVDPGIQGISAEPPGEHCPHGGVAIQRGTDTDRDGKLAASEVVATAWVCNGAPGSTASLSPADADTCPGGGFVYSVNGASTALCNGKTGTDGSSPAVQVSAAVPSSCPGGGITVTVNAVASTVCNGTAGDAGTDGKAPSVSMQAASSAQCPAGGVVMRVDGAETILCSGVSGASGQAPVISVLPISSGEGSRCATGGLLVTVNGTDTVVCNGAPGAGGTAPSVILSAATAAQCAHGGAVLSVSGQSTAVCAGAPGTGGNTPALSVAPATSECPRGGIVVTLEQRATPICHGDPGATGAVPQVSIAAAGGQQCALGGLVLTVNGTQTALCNGKEGHAGAAFSLAATPDHTHCPHGGVVITVNGTDTLICNGSPGSAGAAPTVSTAGANPSQCPGGGVVLTVNGTQTVLCAGTGGSSGTAPSVTSVAATPAQCAHGGVVVTVGATSTALCNAAPGAAGVGTLTTAPAGAECPAGGLAVTVSGVLTSICNGAPGTAGNNGTAPVVNVASASYAQCPNGGAVVTLNTSVIPVCNGERGAPGGPVTVNVGAASATECATGGSVFTFDGTSTAFCNGAQGIDLCNPTNCPTGCCQAGTCVAYADQSTSTCGAGGNDCGACGATELCRTSPTGGVCAACEIMVGDSPASVQATVQNAWNSSLAMPCIESTGGTCTKTEYDPTYRAMVRIAPGTYNQTDTSTTTHYPLKLQGTAVNSLGCGPACTCPSGQPTCDLSSVTGCAPECYLRTHRDEVVPAHVTVKTCNTGTRPSIGISGGGAVMIVGGPDTKSQVAATVQELALSGTTSLTGIQVTSVSSLLAKRNRFSTLLRGVDVTTTAATGTEVVLVDNEFTKSTFGVGIQKTGTTVYLRSDNGYGNIVWGNTRGGFSWGSGHVSVESPMFVYLQGGTATAFSSSAMGIYTQAQNGVGGFNVSTATLDPTTGAFTVVGNGNEGLDPDTFQPLLQIMGSHNAASKTAFQYGTYADKTSFIGLRNIAFANMRTGVCQNMVSGTSTTKRVTAANLRMSNIARNVWYKGTGSAYCESPDLVSVPQRSIVWCGSTGTTVMMNPSSGICATSTFTACSSMTPAYTSPPQPSPYPADTSGLLMAPGLPCTSSAECANGQSCCPATGPQVCSINGDTTPTISNGICVGLGLNQKCADSSQCASNNCNTSIGKCVPPATP